MPVRNDAPIRTVQVGPYRLQHRPGQGRPLLIILPGPVEQPEVWFRPGFHAARPLAVMCEREMNSFESPAVSAAGERFGAVLLYAAWNERDTAQARLLEGLPQITLAEMPTSQHSFYRLLPLRRGGANSLAHIQAALTQKHRMPEAEALVRANRLHAAMARAAAKAPDLISLYAITPRASGGTA